MLVEFDYNEKTIDQIIKSYYLNVLTPPGVVRENIAVALKHLYFYSGISRSNIESEKKMLYRQMIILSYSAIEAIIISIAYTIQSKCRKCDRCMYHDVSMFLDTPEVNRRNAFYNADKFLRKTGILDIPKEDLDFYSNYRALRNEIHLINSEQILSNPHYSDEFCKKSVDFLRRFFECLKDNFTTFMEKYCRD